MSDTSSKSDRSQLVKVVLVIVLLAAAGFLLSRQFGGRPGSGAGYAYYYELSSGKLVVDHASLVSPIREGQAVLAAVYACGDCADAGQRKIAWIEKFTDEAKEAVPTNTSAAPTGDATSAMQAMERGYLVAAGPAEGAEPEWVPVNSRQGRMLRGKVFSACDGKGGQLCRPKSAKE